MAQVKIGVVKGSNISRCKVLNDGSGKEEPIPACINGGIVEYENPDLLKGDSFDTIVRAIDNHLLLMSVEDIVAITDIQQLMRHLREEYASGNRVVQKELIDDDSES